MFTDSMKVSIITVCLNSAETLEQTIRSVINQTYNNIEYIIIDGGSTDGTLDIISKYENKLAKWISKNDNGLYDAMNKGIMMATGEVIGILNSDDWYDIQTVEKVVEAFEKEKADVVYGIMEKVYARGYTCRMKNEPLDQMCYNMVIPHPTAFVKREVYQQVGTFDLKYRIVADYDLFMRIYLRGLKIAQINDVLTYFREGGLSTARAIECANEERMVAYYYADQRQDVDAIECIESKYQAKLTDAKNKQKINKIVMCYKKEAKEILEKCIKNKTSLKIFGAGVKGIECFLFLKDLEVHVESFIDNKKAGSRLWEISVQECKPKNEGKEFIVIAVMNYQEEIMRQLIKEGYRDKEDFCTYYDLIDTIYSEICGEVVANEQITNLGNR